MFTHQLIKFFILLFTISPALGQKNALLQVDSLPKNILSSELNFLTDSSEIFDVEDIISEISDWSASIPTSLLSGEADLIKYWVKFSLINTSNSDIEIAIVLPSYKITNIYTANNNKVNSVWQGGILQRKNNSLLIANKDVFNVLLPAGDTSSIYIELINATQNFSPFHLTLKIPTELKSNFTDNYHEDRKNILWNAAFLGIILFQLVYIYFQWFWIRKKEYVLYIIYIIVEGVYFLNKMEYSLDLKILYSYYPALSVYFDRTLPIFSIYFYYKFARYFIDLPNKMPLLNKRVKILENTMLFYSVADFIFIILTYNLALEAIFINLISLIVFIASLYIIISFLKQRMALYYFIIAGSLFLLFGSIGSLIAYNLANAGHNIGFNPILILQIAFVLEIFCFTTGLAYKARLDSKERILSQQQLIHELEEMEKLQNKMQTIREKIARDLHDDIGANLGSISFYSKAALKQLDDKTKIEEIIREIESSAKETVDNLSDVVWAVDTNNDSTEKLILRIEKFCYQMLSPHDIEMHFNTDAGIFNIKMDMEVRKNVFLICKEAIHNIAKYASCKTVFLNFTLVQNYLKLEIKDDGSGFDLEETNSYNGNGLRNIKKRGKEVNADITINSEIGAGTKIVCIIPLLPNLVIGDP